MTDVNLAEVLPTLEQQARRLNQASERANTALAAIEQRLVAANIGLEFWEDEAFLDASDTTGDIAPGATEQYTKEVLGFARVAGRWCLAVKTLRIVRGFYEGDMSAPYENEFVASEPTPLLSASRALRVNALGAMPNFLERFTVFVASTVEAVEGAAAKLTKRNTK